MATSDLNSESLSQPLAPPPEGVSRVAIVTWNETSRTWIPMLIHDVGERDDKSIDHVFAVPNTVTAIQQLFGMLAGWMKAVEQAMRDRVTNRMKN